MKNTQSYVQALKRQKMTWQQVGDLIGISRALAWRVGHGLCDSHKARAYFGLPPKLVGVVPCRVCGEVHTHKHCPSPRDKGRYRRAGEFATQARVEMYDAMLEECTITTTDLLNSSLDNWLANLPDNHPIVIKYFK